MAQSIKLGSDTYLDSSGIVVNSSHKKLSECGFEYTNLLQELNIPTTETSYSCEWNNYDALVICGIFYSNILGSIIVPKSYFNSTTASSRIIYTNSNGSTYYIRKNSTNSVYINVGATAQNYGISIYGIKFGI